MKLPYVLLLALVPALTVASTTNLADCLPGAVNNGRAAGTASNFAKIKGMGELAFVGRDPTTDEASNTCYVLNLKGDNTYDLRYKDSTGSVKKFNGTFQEQRTTVPVINTQDAYAQLKDAPATLLNGGSLFPIAVLQDEIIFQTCRIALVNGIRSTYVAVPLAQAKLNAAIGGCGGCSDWNTA